jgi:hypothetical protein
MYLLQYLFTIIHAPTYNSTNIVQQRQCLWVYCVNMVTNWLDITYSLLDIDQDIRLKIESEVLDHTYKKTHCGT